MVVDAGPGRRAPVRLDPVRQAWIVWGAIGLGIVMLLVVASLTLTQARPPRAQVGIIRAILFGFSLAAAGLAWRLRRRLPEGALRPGGDQRSLERRYQLAIVLGSALADAIVIWGVVVYALGRNRSDLVLFAVIGIVTWVAIRPRREEYEAVARRLRTGIAGDGDST